MLVTLTGNRYLVYDEKTSDHTCVFTEAAVRVESVAVPVTSILAPVMYRESSEARKAQTSATSGGRQQDDKKKCDEVSETESVRHTQAQSTSSSFTEEAPSSFHKGVKHASSLTCWLTHPAKRHQRRHLKNMTDETKQDDSVVPLESQSFCQTLIWLQIKLNTQFNMSETTFSS